MTGNANPPSSAPSNSPERELKPWRKTFSKIKTLALNVKPEDVPETLAHIARLCIDAGAAPPAQRNWTEDASHENGNYECLCCECDQSFIGHKRRVICKACSSLAALRSTPDASRIQELEGARTAVIEECAQIAAAMRKKHGSPIGDAYSCGVWDQGIRIEQQIRARSASIEARPTANCGVHSRDDDLVSRSEMVEALADQRRKMGDQYDDLHSELKWVRRTAIDRIERLENACRRGLIDLHAAKTLAQHTLGEPHGINQTIEIIEAALALPSAQLGCGDPGCKDPNCEYGK